MILLKAAGLLLSCSLFFGPVSMANPNRSPATFSMGMASANDPNIQEVLQEIRKRSGLSSTATYENLERVILRAMVQTYALAEMNLYDFDLMIQNLNLEKIMNSKDKDAAAYPKLIALRHIKEVLNGALKSIIVSETEYAVNNGETPDYGAHIIAEIAAMQLEADQEEKHHFPYVLGSREKLVTLALEEIIFFVEDVKLFVESAGNERTFGLAEAKNAERTTERVKELRATGIFAKVSRKHEKFDSIFSPARREKGIDVSEWMNGNTKAIEAELRENLVQNRKPGEEPKFAIHPSAGPEGNITGSAFPMGTWALTYDDGPGKTTADVLANLKKHKMSATFFMLSQQIESSKVFQGYAKDELDHFETACHSYSHQQMPKLTDKGQYKEIEGAAQIYNKIIGLRPRYFRLPYGAGVSNPGIREKIAKSCMVHVYWNVDTLDWQDKNPASIKARAIKQIEHLGRGVILFHDIHTQSVTASEMLMTWFQEQQKASPEKNIRLVTLSEITDELNGGKKWTCQVEASWMIQNVVQNHAALHTH